MARVEALELENLIAVALAAAFTANKRTESRGAHSREDYPARDDENWMKHIVISQDDKISYRPVNATPSIVPPFKPSVRKY